MGGAFLLSMLLFGDSGTTPQSQRYIFAKACAFANV
jgi:hypothetical protein